MKASIDIVMCPSSHPEEQNTYILACLHVFSFVGIVVEGVGSCELRN